MANFSPMFSALFLQDFSQPPPPSENSCPKRTPKIVGIPLRVQMSEPKIVHADFLLTEETKILNYLTNISIFTLPKMFENYLGNVFIPNGIESPQMWVWPQVRFGRSPSPSPPVQWRTLQTITLPSAPIPSLFPHPPALIFFSLLLSFDCLAFCEGVSEYGLKSDWSGEFQVTVGGVTVCLFSRHKGKIRDPNAFKTRLKCMCHEIALSVTRQTCTWNCPVGQAW